MSNRKLIVIFFIILLFSLEFIIKYSLNFYNKKLKITYDIKNFNENTYLTDDGIITYYESHIFNNNSENITNIVFIHSLFESSCSSSSNLRNTFDIQKNTSDNFRIMLIDLPAHGKSFKRENYDYSYRNISSSILRLLENLNLQDIYLICDKLSSNIGLNMVGMNDKIFSNLILINPAYKYNSSVKNLTLSIKNKLYPLINLALLYKNRDDTHLEDYINSCFNNFKSSNKYVKRILKESTPITIDECRIPQNIHLSFVITNPNKFNKKYLKNLSNNFLSIFFNPHRDLITHIIK